MVNVKGVTATKCVVCTKLKKEGLPESIVGKYVPQQSLNHISERPAHNWYFFTLGYSPKFVEYEIKKKKIKPTNIVLDPFTGSGTTPVECKLNGINCWGIEANPFFVFASKTKTTWNLPISKLEDHFMNTKNYLEKIKHKSVKNQNLQGFVNFQFLDRMRNSGIIQDTYISKKPLEKLSIIYDFINQITNSKIRNFFLLGYASILVPSSNVRFGPNFGLIKPKSDVDVFDLFLQKIRVMINDIKHVKGLDRVSSTTIKMGDSRNLSEVCNNQKFDHVITSPPYPGDHDYSRHTRLELCFLEFAKNKADVKTIKKRMVGCSTRNIFSGDNLTEEIEKFSEIKDLINKVQKRVVETNGTSGFEKLYHRVVGEYFGGMNLFFQNIYDVLEKNGTLALLVGDSHGFKMVHIQTAKLLGRLAQASGFTLDGVELWQNKRSTAHKFLLPEYILNLKKG